MPNRQNEIKTTELTNNNNNTKTIHPLAYIPWDNDYRLSVDSGWYKGAS